MIPSKYTEQKLANKGSPTINSLLDEKKKKKNTATLIVTGNSKCHMVLIDQSRNENLFSAIRIFIILVNSTLIRKHWKVLIFIIIRSKIFVFVY